MHSAPGSTGLCTDMYELPMAASYLRRGMRGPATFSLIVRELPPERGFLVAAGLADALDFLAGYRLSIDDVDHLHRTLRLPAYALDALRDVRFTGDVWAVPEGRLVFAGEPLLEVTAPIAEGQLVETALLNLVTYQTAIAAKAARCRIAAAGVQLVDFAFRRTHGIEAGIAAARASAIAGFTATSNLAAARRYGLTAAGTMAHSFVEAFPTERAAFAAFAADSPDRPTFLVDTYDTLEGVRHAVAVARELAVTGPIGIRLDSGDLAGLAFAARDLLDEAGMPDARIVASGGLDEYAIADLVAAGAPVDAYGVGTRMGVAADAPSLDTAYKLVAYAGRPVMKLSTGKATLPGPKQVFRMCPGLDVIGCRDETAPDGYSPLLAPVMAGGRRCDRDVDEYGRPDSITAAAARVDADLAVLDDSVRRVRGPLAPVPVVSRSLGWLREDVHRALLDQRAAERLPLP